jgi:hypothetical protein
VSKVKGAVCAISYGLASLDKLMAQTEEGKQNQTVKHLNGIKRKIKLGEFSGMVAWLAVLQVCSV